MSGPLCFLGACRPDPTPTSAQGKPASSIPAAPPSPASAPTLPKSVGSRQVEVPDSCQAPLVCAKRDRRKFAVAGHGLVIAEVNVNQGLGESWSRRARTAMFISLTAIRSRNAWLTMLAAKESF
jgi:hypothetical protein